MSMNTVNHHGETQMMLSVKPGSRYLWRGDEIFFWMGDTAWLMFHQLTREEIDLYLQNRAQKGFNVIQTVAVHHLPAENVYGRKAFKGAGVDGPDDEGMDSYWALIDWTIHRAAQLGLYIAMLPHWGNVSNELTVEAMVSYVHFLADRYKNALNLIWLTGGDIRGDERPEYWQAMGAVLRKNIKGQLISYHPFGRTSSLDFFPEEDWLDFHMFQSGHRRYDQQSLDCWYDTGAGRYYGEDNWRYVRDAMAQVPVKPVLDGEPSYEHIPQGLHVASEPYWTPQQVRRYGWWSVLAGGAGFTYGHNSIMQFYPGRGDGAFFVRYPWKDALHAPGAGALCHMANLMRTLLDRVTRQAVGAGLDPANYVASVCRPCEDLLRGPSAWKDADKTQRIMAFAVGDYVLCYTYEGLPITIKLDLRQNKKQVAVWWMDPESGVQSYGGIVAAGDFPVTFTPPVGDFSHTDWLLMLRYS